MDQKQTELVSLYLRQKNDPYQITLSYLAACFPFWNQIQNLLTCALGFLQSIIISLLEFQLFLTHSQFDLVQVDQFFPSLNAYLHLYHPVNCLFTTIQYHFGAMDYSYGSRYQHNQPEKNWARSQASMTMECLSQTSSQFCLPDFMMVLSLIRRHYKLSKVIQLFRYLSPVPYYLQASFSQISFKQDPHSYLHLLMKWAWMQHHLHVVFHDLKDPSKTSQSTSSLQPLFALVLSLLCLPGEVMELLVLFPPFTLSVVPMAIDVSMVLFSLFALVDST